MKKRWLRNEVRKNWRIGQRREVGRSPNWVYAQKRDAILDIEDQETEQRLGEDEPRIVKEW